mmetsp:Transcript_5111/g.16412  ORF Transcript_5111/g.16412 Transcript_5111/m.16412 type:complete len:231 (-) Transcript_5111:129-821(-)
MDKDRESIHGRKLCDLHRRPEDCTNVVQPPRRLDGSGPVVARHGASTGGSAGIARGADHGEQLLERRASDVDILDVLERDGGVAVSDLIFVAQSLGFVGHRVLERAAVNDTTERAARPRHDVGPKLLVLPAGVANANLGLTAAPDRALRLLREPGESRDTALASEVGDCEQVLVARGGRHDKLGGVARAEPVGAIEVRYTPVAGRRDLTGGLEDPLTCHLVGNVIQLPAL